MILYQSRFFSQSFTENSLLRIFFCSYRTIDDNNTKMSDIFKVSKRLKRLLICLFTLMGGISILMCFSSMAAIEGIAAVKLNVKGAEYINYIPWVALFLFLSGVVLMFYIKSKWPRLVVVIVYLILFYFVGSYTAYVTEKELTTVRIPEFLTYENAKVFESKFGIPYQQSDSYAEGAVIRVRNVDYTDELRDFLTKTTLQSKREKGGE